LAQGRLDAADAMIRRALGESQDPIGRARLLGAYVEIVLATGNTGDADAAADEFRATASELGTPFLRGQAARATGAVRLAQDDARSALLELRRAFNELNALGVRHDAARTRLLVAAACDALGDHDAARIESGAARSALASLGAPVATTDRATVAPDGLTRREREVLLLVARGKTNKVIAHDLVVSEKTVASHVSHIFTKLGVTSRSAATAYAYDHHLV
jgi:DNA-binding CsgD family transcriptional regulator